MSKGRGHQWLLVGAFLAVIFAVPLVQAAIEYRREGSVQFLDLFRERPTAKNLRAFEDDLEKQSWFAQTLRPWMAYWRFRLLRDAGEKAIVGRDGWWFYRPGVRYLIEPLKDDPKARTGQGPAVAAIVRFRDQLAERGIRLLVVPVPGKPSIYPDMLTARATDEPERVHQHTRRLVAALEQAGVEVVDPFDVLMHAREASSSAGTTDDQGAVYMKRDTHWTQRGLSVVASAVADRLVALGWTRVGNVRYDLKPVCVKRLGDVVRMLRTPRIEASFVPQEFICGQVVRPETGEPYKDDPNAPILVLGDSFLRIYERDEPGSAGFIAHLARGLAQPLASIVNDGGASTLVRQEIPRKPELLSGKKVVIWEFVERDIRFGMEGWQDVELPVSKQEPSRSSSTRP
ncbi:MAG: hypothetical protein JXQ73_17380 [Phycisphaerae bacterium]|nr:hypothetical protein [Phycisphaerae bacterium]